MPRLRLVHSQRQQCGEQLQQLLDEYGAEEAESHPEGGPGDVAILRSLPGVGRMVATSLLARAAQALHEADQPALRAYGGLAPITRRSGKSRLVLMRHACDTRLRNAFSARHPRAAVGLQAAGSPPSVAAVELPLGDAREVEPDLRDGKVGPEIGAQETAHALDFHARIVTSSDVVRDAPPGARRLGWARGRPSQPQPQPHRATSPQESVSAPAQAIRSPGIGWRSSPR